MKVANGMWKKGPARKKGSWVVGAAASTEVPRSRMRSCMSLQSERWQDRRRRFAGVGAQSSRCMGM